MTLLIQSYFVRRRATLSIMKKRIVLAGLVPASLARSIGFWMALAMAASQGLNAVRAFRRSAGFCHVYMGAPSSAAELSAWVQIYGLRAAFIALLVGVFLIRKEFSPLKWMAICALFLPLCDAWIAMQAGAPTSVLLPGTLGIAVFLALGRPDARSRCRRAEKSREYVR